MQRPVIDPMIGAVSTVRRRRNSKIKTTALRHITIDPTSRPSLFANGYEKRFGRAGAHARSPAL
jgi:hypothetical protein